MRAPCLRRRPGTLSSPRLAPLACAALLACHPTLHAQAQPQQVAAVQTLTVVGTTPLGDKTVPLDQVPANLQAADAAQMRALQSLNLPDFMGAQLPSVTINQTQGNPYQMTLNYRGFSASPLLGLPQGLSVYLDGVRMNEPFGDVVNWDLIPQQALSDMTLLPGSNPLFGLNTLGGALVLRSKSGDTDPGGEVEVQGGSFGRRSVDLSYGQKVGEHGHLFGAFSGFDEDGWRDFSPSRVRQVFLKGGERQADQRWDLSLAHGDSTLVGNGLTPESMLAVDRRQIFTRPDETRHQATLLTLDASRLLGDGLTLSGTAYLRRLNGHTLNGDLNDDYDGVDNLNTGVEHRTRTTDRSQGLTLQLSQTRGAHQLSLGAAWDQARNHFEQSSAEGMLDATRAVVDTEEAEVDAKIRGSQRTASVYASDLITLSPELHLTLSGRYNHTRVHTTDLGRTELGLDTNLDGQGTYAKFNPAAGLSWRISPALTAFGSFSQGNRAPSPIELGCSDPAHPCVLPNALQSDPPLKQVVARTLEAGLRGWFARDLRWSASAYRTDNHDDLLFISNGHAAGYFTNVGSTRRQGLELSLSQDTDAFDWRLAYSLLDATFRHGACLLSESNSSAGSSDACPGEGEIAVRPGDRMAGLPRHSLKLTANAQLRPGWTVGAQFSAYSSQRVQGNENGQQQPDGVDFFGSGHVAGYALLDLTTNIALGHGVEVFAKVANVFDRRYATGGSLAQNPFDSHGQLLPPDQWHNAQFAAPGAPRAVWLGLRWRFDALSL